MVSAPPLLSFLLIIVSGWVHRHQLIVIEFLQAENQFPKRQLRGKRIRFPDAERALLARKVNAVGVRHASSRSEYAQARRRDRVGLCWFDVDGVA